MVTEPQFELRIPSDTKVGQEIQDRIIGLMEEREYSTRDVFCMRLALEEAIVNAIKHGNKQDPEKSVLIRCDVTDEKAVVFVQDEGPGFDLADVPDPTDDANLDKPSGRGIMLMQSMLDRIEYNETGNAVEIEKLRSAPEAE